MRTTTVPETRPDALVEYKHAIAVINNGKTVRYVAKFLTKLTFLFLKNGGKLHITVTGPRRYSVDFKQGEMELSADCFTSLIEKLFLKMKEKTLGEVQKNEKLKKGTDGNPLRIIILGIVKKKMTSTPNCCDNIR